MNVTLLTFGVWQLRDDTVLFKKRDTV